MTNLEAVGADGLDFVCLKATGGLASLLDHGVAGGIVAAAEVAGPIAAQGQPLAAGQLRVTKAVGLVAVAGPVLAAGRYLQLHEEKAVEGPPR